MSFRCASAVAMMVLSAPSIGATTEQGFAFSDLSPALQLFLSNADEEALLDPGSVVDCTLSGGAQTKCVRFVMQANPASEPGPWCPRLVSDGPEAGGFWIRDGAVYDVDGPFIRNLAEFYDNPDWLLYDPDTGEVKATRSFQACFLAARPQVPEDYYNYCAECTPDQAISGENFAFFVPIAPVAQDTPTAIRDMPGAGVALDGVRLNGPAPYDDIVQALNVAPFDDCGGHVNPFNGYHYHFATDCLHRVEVSSDHAPMIGLSLDGFGIFRRLDNLGHAPVDLDECGGHSDGGLDYHYHAAPVGTNAIIGCLKAQLGCAAEGGTQTCDASNVPPPPRVETAPSGGVQPLVHAHDDQP
ncbi:MAG: YHYH protein [Pseudomonadota bacterium]